MIKHWIIGVAGMVALSCNGCSGPYPGDVECRDELGWRGVDWRDPVTEIQVRWVEGTEDIAVRTEFGVYDDSGDFDAIDLRRLVSDGRDLFGTECK